MEGLMFSKLIALYIQNVINLRVKVKIGNMPN